MDPLHHLPSVSAAQHRGRVPWRRGMLLLEATCLLGCAGLAVRLLPFRLLAPLLGTPAPLPTPFSTPQAGPRKAQLACAQEIAWAMAAIRPHTPWRSHCLPQALAARALLARRHIPATLYLGALLAPAPGAAGPASVTGPTSVTGRTFIGHAWLCCGPLCITGSPHGSFTPLAAYR